VNVNRLMRHVGRYVPAYSLIEKSMNKSVNKGYYRNRLSEVGLVDSDMLIVGTVARSGTHYAMLLLANYIAHSAGQKDGYSPSEMNDLFPNNWHLSYLNYHNIPFGPYNNRSIAVPDKRINCLGVNEITRSHAVFQRVFWKNSKVLHLYRNPLDYSVSLYNYKHKKRPDLPDRLASPNDVLELKFENYVAMYKSYVQAARSGKYRLFRLAYEELIRSPEFYLDAILRWMGLEPSADIVVKAVESSSIKRTKEQEAKGSVVNPTALGLKGSFISSGVVGQWRSHYSDSEFRYWEQKFESEGINLNSFILE